MCVDERGRPVRARGLGEPPYLAEVMERFGLGDRWALLFDGGGEVLGMAATALERARGPRCFST